MSKSTTTANGRKENEMTSLTNLEMTAIKAIFHSDYAWGSGVEGTEVIGTPVWSFSVHDGIPGSKASRGGVIASLSTKGLIEFASYDEDDDCIILTQAGFDAYVAAGGVFPKSE